MTRLGKSKASRLKKLFDRNGGGSAEATNFDSHFASLRKRFLANQEGIDHAIGDTAKYHSFTLENGLQCLLVEDPSLKSVGCAMSVGVGYFHDPDELPGLAHLLEHMVFIGGSAKYPVPGQFDELVSKVMGKKNAYTTSDETNFHFSIPSTSEPVFREILDRFVNNFVDPLFDAEAIRKEAQVVDNEYSKNIGLDLRRQSEILRATSNANHPFQKFSCGNLETLVTIPEEQQIDVRQELQRFFDEYYSASIMKLVIISPFKSAMLRRLVTSLFAPLKQTAFQSPVFHGSPITQLEQGRRFEVIPMESRQQIVLAWMLEENQNFTVEYPHYYLVEALQMRTKGSLMHYLESKGWAKNIQLVALSVCRGKTLLWLAVECTEAGIWDHTEDIVSSIFAYIQHLVQNGLPAAFVRYVAAKGAASFASTPFQDTFSMARTVASNMLAFPSRQFLTGNRVLYSYRHESFKALLSSLSPDRHQQFIVHRGAEESADRLESRYGATYAVCKIPTETLARYASSVIAFKHPTVPDGNQAMISTDPVLPFENPRPASLKGLRNIPASLRKLPLGQMGILSSPMLSKGPTQKPGLSIGMVSIRHHLGNLDLWRRPCLVLAKENGLLWMKQNVLQGKEFQVQEIIVSCFVHQPECYTSVAGDLDSRVLLYYYMMFLKESLSEIKSQSSNIGVEAQVASTESGLFLLFAGMDSRVFDVIADTLQAMKSTKRLKTSSLRRYKMELTTELQGRRRSPMDLAEMNTDMLMREPRWSYHEVEARIKTVKFRDVLAFIPTLFKNKNIQVVVTGNITPSRSIAVYDMFEKHLLANSHGHSFPNKQVTHLPDKSHTYFICRHPSAKETNSAIHTLFQVGDATYTHRAALLVLGALIQAPCRDFIRTKEAVGYLVSSSTSAIDKMISLSFRFQSNSFSPMEMDSKLEAFLEDFDSILKKMDPIEIEKTKATTIARLRNTPRSAKDEHQKWCYHIHSTNYSFDLGLYVSERVVALTKEDLVSFYRAYIAGGAPKRRKIVSGVLSALHESAEMKDIQLEQNHGFGEHGINIHKTFNAQVRHISDPYEFKYERDVLSNV